MKRLNNDMLACGEKGLPETVSIDGYTWHRRKTFKHDFFACTGLYGRDDSPQKLVLKLGRTQSFLGLPMCWLGRMLCRRERKIIDQLRDIDQLPKLLDTFDNGLAYHYIEGQSLDERPILPDHFFYHLGKLLDAIHRRNICYVDMNKRGNILIGKDHRPYLIDFQISLYLPRHWSGFLKHAFQKEDRYHLLKHKRRFRPDLLKPDEWERLDRKSLSIRIHRAIGGNLRDARRWLLRLLYRKQLLKPDLETLRTPENDHTRFLR